MIFGISLASAFRSWWKPLAGAVLVVTSMNQDTISLIWLCKSIFRFTARMPSHRYCRYTMSLSQTVLHFLSCCSSHTEGPAILAVRFYQMGVHMHIATQNIPLLVYSFACIGRRRSQRKLQM